MGFTPVLEADTNGGIQKIYRFANGYGASVIQSEFSYGGTEGKWELAVVTFENEKPNSFHITYQTPITSDVLGYLSQYDVDRYLEEINDLEPLQ